ncbi:MULTISPECIES: polysaccharide biosynthesis tyrosine autokinase [unclassified Moorena]|uniref:GumC family protein n=1 Tax=unclassified Moorena TaxID=2683338 RepID=UPI0013FF2BF3|nr:MULTISPECIES: polysaccharide biosynthesis tyrosine autokinase [unclassified Moorena]NEO11747.1 polysaccharide biosynthesis tyrosine autokinase [Moorena sp. SIO3E8]NEP98352.1 polysaccharide biosynthesis tyrosine autokinase [Moorena sp. SIO3F7]
MGSQGAYKPSLSKHSGQQQYRSSPQLTGGAYELEASKLDLRRILAAARRRAVLMAGVALTVTSGIIAKTLSAVPIYEGKFQLLLEPISGEDPLELQAKPGVHSIAAPTKSFDYDTQIQVLSSPQVMSEIVEQIQTQYPEINYHTLREGMMVSRLRETKILEVAYQDSDPERIQFVLEKVALGYIEYSKQQQQASIKQGIQFVSNQQPKIQGQINQLQLQLQQLQQKYNLINPQLQGELLTNRVNAIVEHRQATQTQLRDMIILYGKLKGQLGLSSQQAEAVANLIATPRYQQLLNQLSKVEGQMVLDLAEFKENQSTFEGLRQQQQNLLPLLSQEAEKVINSRIQELSGNAQSGSSSTVRLNLIQQLVETANQIKVLEMRQVAIAKGESLISEKLKQLAVIADRYTELKQKIEVATESLNRFESVRETLELESAKTSIPWQTIVEPQQPEKPISPNLPDTLLLSAAAGIVAGATAGFLAEKLHHLLNSTDDIKEYTRFPILATIPFNKELQKCTTVTGVGIIPEPEASAPQLGVGSGSYQISPVLEAFRSLQVNLQCLYSEKPISAIVVTSAEPVDGKSTTAIFLALAAAAMGQKVLLVDANLRFPQIHQKMDLPNLWGLSDVISSEIKVDDVIQRSPLEENLCVLSAGQISPDPTRLLNSPKMENLVQYLKERFELVIFDTPPLLGLADARLLEPNTDGILMVVGLGKAKQILFKEALSELRIAHSRVLGIVANGLKGYTTGSYDYYHHYFGNTLEETKV